MFSMKRGVINPKSPENTMLFRVNYMVNEHKNFQTYMLLLLTYKTPSFHFSIVYLFPFLYVVIYFLVYFVVEF